MSEYEPVKIAYLTHGKVELDHRPNPVIFIHALTQLKECWHNIPEEVANATERTVYSIDARNHGESEWSDEFSFDLVALDLIHFMDKLDIPKAIVVGDNMGGVAAMKAALKHPERFEAIVVIDTGVKMWTEEAMESGSSLLFLLAMAEHEIPSELDEEEAKKFVYAYVASKVFKRNVAIGAIKEKDVPDAVHIKRSEDDGRWYLIANYAVIIKGLLDGTIVTPITEGTYSGPAAFIYGSKGAAKYIEEQEDHIKRFFPNAKLFHVEGRNRSLVVDNPKDLTKSLLKFLWRVGQG